MIVFDSHKNHFSTQFEEFCKEKNIITLYLFTHSLHLIQPLNIGCFNVFKRTYSKKLKYFIKAYINHIIKTEILLIFKVVYNNTITAENI